MTTRVYEVREARGMHGIEGYNLFLFEKCSCCENEKSKWIGRFEIKMHAQQYCDYLNMEA